MKVNQAISSWMEHLFNVWRNGDISEIGNIFASCHFYMEGPFEPAVAGSNAICELWAEVSSQSDIKLTYTVLSFDGLHATVRWQASFLSRDSFHELDGIYFIEFSTDGLCKRFMQWTEEK